ncbi:hypothetical protein PLICRDRAFT_206016 [Plicaturopsis crispa FD-325 SS-3]|nr:hypothetical protein PLICRDRAFT_206016 [Plicaturopsis crispa FD-325 SS-3]
MEINPAPIAGSDYYRTLPIELEHGILGHLQSEPEALKSCALVCASWRSRAQSLLFEVVHLDRTGGHLFARLLDGSPHIGPYIKILVVWGVAAPRVYEPILMDETLPLIAPALVNLHTLDMTVQAWTRIDLSPSTRTTLADCLGRSLRTLKLESQSEMEINSDFIRFIVGFPLLENFEIRGPGGVGAVEATPITLAMPPSFRIKRLAARWVDSCELLRWFLDMDIHPELSIRSLEVEVRPENRIIVGRLLRRLGPALEEYTTHMQIPEDSDIVAAVKDTSPSNNTSLRKLTLDGLGIYDCHNDWQTVFLQEVSSPALSEVEFRVYFRGDLRALDLPFLEKILVSPKFSTLKRVVFTLQGSPHGLDDIIADVRTKMSVLREKKMLEFRRAN